VRNFTTGLWLSSDGPVTTSWEGPSMASLGDELVLFAGGQTWVWKGGAWTRKNVRSPSARRSGAMASFRGKALLFGGWRIDGNSSTLLADTWEWDGSAWTEKQVAGPPARHSHAMAVLP
jgi:hypothetical protein